MKKTFILLFFLCQSVAAFSQLYVDGVRLDVSNTSAYLETIVRIRDRDNPSFYFIVDYGQKAKPGLNDGDYLTDAGGRRYEFRSVVDGLNFLFENGWEVVQVYVYNDLRRYLLKRRQ